MWHFGFIVLFFTPLTSTPLKKETKMFRQEQVIFTSNFNITKLLVPAHGAKLHNKDSTDIPSIFFTVVEPKLEGNSCIYVLEDFVAYEILEGGRDSTADYSNDDSIYFGAHNGLYKYCPESLSAKKYGPFRDNIIQLQKSNESDIIYYLTGDNQIFKVENNGTIRSRVKSISCATEFVLDTSNNIYYIDCGDNMIHIVKNNGDVLSLTASVIEEFVYIKLIRPPFIMANSIPFIGDGILHVLYSNGSLDKKDFYMEDRPSAFSVDAALYLVVAVDGQIYEYNVMDDLIKTMFGKSSKWPSDISRLFLSVVDTAKDGIFGMYRGWYL